jgi:hypothetical protein
MENLNEVVEKVMVNEIPQTLEEYFRLHWRLGHTDFRLRIHENEDGFGFYIHSDHPVDSMSLDFDVQGNKLEMSSKFSGEPYFQIGNLEKHYRKET